MAIGINQLNFNTIKTDSAKRNEGVKTEQPQVSSPIINKMPGRAYFCGVLSPFPKLTGEDKIKYNEISAALGPKTAQNLETLLKTGRLLNKNSSDGSSALDNLYKIIKTERVQGLDKKQILQETINTITNPFIITQRFGDIPDKEANAILSRQSNLNKPAGETDISPKSKDDMNIAENGSSTCVASSIEFNLADKKPAEFTRFIEGLTSPAGKVTKIMKYKDISPQFIDSLAILKQFNAETKALNFETFEITLAPDKDALTSAIIQSSYKDPGERSLVDVLMQSTIMQAGSQQTYNTLTDKRHGELNEEKEGLTDYEKSYAESVISGEGPKTSVVYQKINDNKQIEGYEYDAETVKTQILKTLESGSNVIVGLTSTDENKTVIGGHEITITGVRYDEKGEMYFICNDTDDDKSEKIEKKASDFIPMIHHAGIPASIIGEENGQGWRFELFKSLPWRKSV